MWIGILKEKAPEQRVAASPDLVHSWIKGGHRVWVEQGAGMSASFDDASYLAVGASCTPMQERPADLEVLVVVHSLPHFETWQSVNPHAPLPKFLIGMLMPDKNRVLLEPWVVHGVTLFGLEAMPRTTRAQGMDVLSSQASLGGYQAVVEAACLLPRCFPMMMTAAGTVAPARVLVIGAGVAGLQALATAKRLGAVVRAFDTRPSVREQVQSLGGQFVEVEGAVEDKSAGGYAVEQSEEYRQRQKALLEAELLQADVVVTTAQIPGKQAPLLVPTSVLERMKAGAVVMDLAAGSGGNCEGTVDGQNLNLGRVLVCGRSAPASSKAQDASRLYARNVGAFTALLETGQPGIWDVNADELVQACCLASQGSWTTPKS